MGDTPIAEENKMLGVIREGIQAIGEETRKWGGHW
jgi:hypothetical protein